MTYAQIISDTKTRIGSTPEVSDSEIGTWVNQGLRVFCSEYDFAWLQKHSQATTVASQEKYGLPSDFKRMIELQVDGTSASPKPYERTSHEFRVLNASGQLKYSLFDEQLWLYPIPDSTGDLNIDMYYLRKPTNMSSDGEAPSDSTIANMPEEYHEALVIYAFAIYNSYDEEHGEKQELLGNPRNPLPGTFYYFVDMARKNDQRDKKAQRSRMLSKQESVGHAYPNRISNTTTVLGN